MPKKGSDRLNFASAPFPGRFRFGRRDEQRLIPPARRWSRIHGRVRRLLEKTPRFVTFVLLVNSAGPSHATCLNINALQPDEEVDLIKRRLARR
jgi:hypothetical protein